MFYSTFLELIKMVVKRLFTIVKDLLLEHHGRHQEAVHPLIQHLWKIYSVYDLEYTKILQCTTNNVLIS